MLTTSWAEEVLKGGRVVEGPVPTTHTELSVFYARALNECLYTDASKFYDFFRPITVPSTTVEGAHEYLSEDWAFNWRARQANAARPQYIWTGATLRHWGLHGYMMQTSAKERW